ncbi:MAG: archaetidylserine decarboxylase [Kiritimatiellae bacterium]|nr:archaetidylserine decarboxylase [Kiritimatiellia bacterium]
MNKVIEYIDRESGKKVTESVMGDKALRFAYETLLGRTLWPVLFGSKLISSIMGRKYDSPSSKSAIRSLASIPGCKYDEAEKPLEEYGSFNEFFTRHLKPNARTIGQGLVSPADGRLMLYLNADADLPFPLKGAKRSLKEVFDRHSTDVLGGKMDVAVIRLAPVDYHRFHFPIDCHVEECATVIPGKYHSVNPIALLAYPDVYADNERQIVKCSTEAGVMYLVDVGAFGVGTIIQTFEPGERKKGEEKGYFKFGGSTVIMITEAGRLKFAEDIVANSAAGYETRVKMGETIAEVRHEI